MRYVAPMNSGKFLRLAAASAIALSGFAHLAHAAKEGFVELADKSGRTIEAKILIVAGEEVEIEMANGHRYTLPISRFSLSSQALIRKGGAAAGTEPAPEPDTPAPPAPSDFSDDPIFDFVDLEFKEKKLDHFRILTIDTRNDPADKYAEKIYELFEEFVPALPGIFGKQGFRGPGEPPNSHDFPEPDKLFRYRIYLVEESGDYQSMIDQYAKEYTDAQARQHFLNSAGKIGSFIDLKHRFLVIRKEAGRPAQQLLAHLLGHQLIDTRIEQLNTPFWLAMGAGYFSEHKMFNRCAIHYVDFDNYYESEPGGGRRWQNDPGRNPLKFIAVAEAAQGALQKRETRQPRAPFCRDDRRADPERFRLRHGAFRLHEFDPGKNGRVQQAPRTDERRPHPQPPGHGRYVRFRDPGRIRRGVVRLHHELEVQINFGVVDQYTTPGT